MPEQTLIPTLQAAFKLASLPADSPIWRSLSGEQYKYHANDQYVILNEPVGPNKRERIIAQIIGSVVVE
jgi:hypothetical protein